LKNIFFIIILIIAFSSCKTISSTNKTTKNINSKKLEKIISKSEFDFDYFSCKTRIIYNKQNYTANIRIKQDSIIWISLTGLFNIEGARIIILKDHYEMINKLNGSYYNEPLSKLERYIPLKVDYKMIEDLLVGNFIEKRIKKQIIETKDNKYIVKGNIDTYNILYSISPHGKIETIDIQGKIEDNSINAQYYKYEKVDNHYFAYRRKFELKNQKEKKLLDLKFYKLNFEKVDFPFKKRH